MDFMVLSLLGSRAHAPRHSLASDGIRHVNNRKFIRAMGNIGKSDTIFAQFSTVIPAQAGIQGHEYRHEPPWIPSFA
jgi:hypothetical protein